MIKIKLTRNIKGKNLTEEFEKIYGSIDKLEEIFKNGKGDKVRNGFRRLEIFHRQS